MYGYITAFRLFIILLCVIAVFLLANLCYLPGPGFLFFPGELAYLAYTYMAVMAILFTPIGLIWFTVSLVRHKRIKVTALLAILIPIFCYIDVTIIKQRLQEFARNYTVKEAGEFINAIEEYNAGKGYYPADPEFLVPEYLYEIPKPGIIGVRNFKYELIDSTYELRFIQNGYSSFNPTIVIYNPLGQQKGDGEYPTLYEIGVENWKYYIYE